MPNSPPCERNYLHEFYTSGLPPEEALAIYDEIIINHPKMEDKELLEELWKVSNHNNHKKKP